MSCEVINYDTLSLYWLEWEIYVSSGTKTLILSLIRSGIKPHTYFKHTRNTQTGNKYL